MPRSLPEWIGATPDIPIPPRVRLRVYERFDKRCGGCRTSLIGRKWTCDHKEALINGGENRENNLWPLCAACEPPKTAADVAVKAQSYAARRAAAGIKGKTFHRPMPCGRFSRHKKPIGSFGTVPRVSQIARTRAVIATLPPRRGQEREG